MKLTIAIAVAAVLGLSGAASACSSGKSGGDTAQQTPWKPKDGESASS